MIDRLLTIVGPGTFECWTKPGFYKPVDSFHVLPEIPENARIRIRMFRPQSEGERGFSGEGSVGVRTMSGAVGRGGARASQLRRAVLLGEKGPSGVPSAPTCASAGSGAAAGAANVGLKAAHAQQGFARVAARTFASRPLPKSPPKGASAKDKTKVRPAAHPLADWAFNRLRRIFVQSRSRG